MPVAIRLEYGIGTKDGEEAVQSLAAAFERAGDEVARFGRYVFPRLLPILEAEVLGQFQAEGRGPVSGGWAPLSLAYAEAKRLVYGEQPILVATGKLRAALTSASSPFAVREYTDTAMAFGTDGVPYASFHQMGTAKMPARPEFDLTADFEKLMVQAGQLGLVDAIRAADKEGLLEVTP